MIYSVIGSNYGDEGKGLAVDYLAARSSSALVVRHNGGAQSGHTVEIEDKRFVFHELSSGSLRGADTYWAETFFPDLYKLEEEIQAFRLVSNRVPRIFASPDCCITTIDDVLVNMLLETARGENRHGSCGMGINEADLRKKAGFKIPICSVFDSSTESLFCELKRVRQRYTQKRLESLKLLLQDGNEYLQLLTDDTVLYNYAKAIRRNVRYISLAPDMDDLFHHYADIIFEGGQGLRLDAEFQESMPHVTASRTGLTNVIFLLNQIGRKVDEVIYVSRTYLTKHGAGSLDNETPELKSMLKITDQTNVVNPWQGELRFAIWENTEDFLRVIRADLACCPYPVCASLMLTHLNETKHRILFREGFQYVADMLESGALWTLFKRCYLSDSHVSEDIAMVKRAFPQ